MYNNLDTSADNIREW